MTLSSQYSTEQMYNEWMNGTPISEIVKKTGIKRKTWNKRFERYEKQLKVATNNNPAVNNGDKSKIVAISDGDNGDKSQLMSRNVANNINNKNRTNKFLAIVAVLGFMLAIYFVYMEIKKRRANQENH